SIYKLLVLEDKNQLIKISNYISGLDTELKIQTLQRLELEYLLNSTKEGIARLEETLKDFKDKDFDFDVDLLINALEQQKNIARDNIFYYEILDRQQKLLNEVISKKRFKPKTKDELRKLINDDRISLANIDTSLITDMSSLFEGSERIDFDGIENWDTSNVINMKSMFAGCKYFNKKLNWDTSKVVDMESMFLGCERLNKLIEFDISNVLVSNGIFYACKRLKPTNIRLKIKN
ncbi:BspA family leucine-rich repeat surface protein, partial [Campylobacter sp. 2018MI27]